MVAANIQLVDPNGNVLESWPNVSAASFPFQIDVMNLTCDKGTLIIEWLMEDEEGNVTSSTQKKTVSFDKQN